MLGRAVDQPWRGREPLTDRVHGAVEPLALGIAAPYSAQNGRVERILTRPAAIRSQLLRPAALLEPAVQAIALLAPLLCVRVGQLTRLGEMERAVERRPNGHLGARVMTLLVELPHPGVAITPEHGDAIDTVGEKLAGVLVEGVPLRDVEVGGLEEVTPRAELELRGRGVAVADGPRVAVAAEVRKLLAPSGDLTFEVVERPEVGRRLAHRAEEPGERLLHLLRQAEPHQRIEREGGVAHPGVAVVVVLVASDRLG